MTHFSYLEKDDKTYKHVLEYIECIKNGKDASCIDCSIQGYELRQHIMSCGGEKLKESSNWVIENSIKIRDYINSVKIISYCLINRCDFLNFCEEVQNFNNNKKLFDTIKFD
jgi:hypothetical protein